MLFPFAPEQPWTKQYSAAHRIVSVHRTATPHAMYRTIRILILTTHYEKPGLGSRSAFLGPRFEPVSRDTMTSSEILKSREQRIRGRLESMYERNAERS